MRIGIVLHGPEIVDVGSAKRIIEMFREHEVIAKLGGTMGRTAVIDAGLENSIDISQGQKPSETINSLNVELAILLNHGKTLDTGRSFGRIVASKINRNIPFVHVERPCCEGRVIYYSLQSKRCAEFVNSMLKKYGIFLPIEFSSAVPLHVRKEGEFVIRRVTGAVEGESIRIDGIIIGEVLHPEPEIVCRKGRVVELRGIKIKQHGLEKLENRKIDIYKAKVRTGSIRRSPHTPRIKKMLREGKSVAVIDHCAEEAFELVKDAGLVVTIGDDTTAIASDILSRLGIPVIGIVDGDIDCVPESAVVPEGSTIICVKPGFDDIVGRKVSELLKGAQKRKRDEVLSMILELAEEYIVDVVYY